MSTRKNVVFVKILCFYIFFTSYSTVGSLRVKMNGTGLKYIYRLIEKDELTISNNVSDLCKPEEEKECSRRSRKEIFSSFTNSTIKATTEVPEESIPSPYFLNCSMAYIPLDPEEYQKQSDGSVNVPLYNKTFDRINYIIREEILILCPDFFAKPKVEQKFLTIAIAIKVCMIISIVCLILHCAMFIFVKRRKNLPGYVLLSLCKALFSAYVCTLINFDTNDSTHCMVKGLFLLYFLLASFFWMNTMLFDVWRSIRMATSKFRLTADTSIMVRFFRYSLYSWGVPLLIIIISIIVHNASSKIKYRLIFNSQTCWFKYKRALIIYFVVPVLSLVGMNIYFFTSSFVMISRATMNESQLNTRNGSNLRSRLFLSLRLSSVMGFIMLFGIIAAFTKQIWIWYFYDICSALQGVFIFFSFTVNERVRKAFRKAFHSRKLSLPTQISSQQTSST